ncbi:cytochrome P460 family protein [Armatimonas sp.]|uniref:cytochrome P460 family protein n=1 Tax=Armatimonas sp. TaxID=1872638 RepID=UPI00286A1360|nr:cytochrome P460 family protein [Armatimonas sp.]
MKRLLSLALALALGITLGVFFSRRSSPTTEEITPEKVVSAYARYTCLTPPNYQVDNGLLMLCRGANPEDVKRAEADTGPHAYSEVRVLVDFKAALALKADTGTFPIGAVVVKEKVARQYPYLKDAPRRPNSVTGMIKRAPGYDPQNGDWEYFIQEAGAPLEKGKISTCIGCHTKAPGPDHLFVPWLKRKTVLRDLR